ncbi:hypothetical protein [Kitasatospora paranensis]
MTNSVSSGVTSSSSTYTRGLPRTVPSTVTASGECLVQLIPHSLATSA